MPVFTGIFYVPLFGLEPMTFAMFLLVLGGYTFEEIERTNYLSGGYMLDSREEHCIYSNINNLTGG